jgi:hypothetical protein
MMPQLARLANAALSVLYFGTDSLAVLAGHTGPTLERQFIARRALWT